MKNAVHQVRMRAKLLIPNYEGDAQLINIMRHIDDTVTTLDGLYTQLMLIVEKHIQDALSYDENARSYLKDYFYTAINAVSYKQVGDDRSIFRYGSYPFATLANPLLEFNRKISGKGPVSLQPLTFATITTGSINIDLLGVGKILEFIEHTTKQILWEANHEKEMSMWTRQKATLEEQLLMQKVIEAHLNNEEKKLYLASKQLELFDTIQNLDLPINQKRKLVKSILDKVELTSITADINIIREK
jgi:hypothetical protein